MEQVADKVKSLVQDNSHEVYSLSYRMIQLEVVQGAVARLLERMEEIVQNGRHEDQGGLAPYYILELKDTVRLIDMGFYPLYTTMQESVNKLEGVSNELFDIIVRPHGGKPIINNEFSRDPESFEEVVAKSEEHKKSRCANIDSRNIF